MSFPSAALAITAAAFSILAPGTVEAASPQGLDTVVYDKVEVIRGANGLLTGTGNPSGTINYIRKRPTNDAFVTTEMSGGTWNKRRLEADASGPRTESGSWAGRVVGAMQSDESYLDAYENERGIVYGILEGQLTERSTLTLGHTWQRNASDQSFYAAPRNVTATLRVRY
jgi:outer membrane receptor for ferric coprogen and ferric-rhodotorulic acid